MYRLYELLYKFRVFIFFLLLEVVCFTLIVRNNKYHSAAFFNSSNALSGTVYSFTSSVNDYFVLRTQNDNLVQENAELRKKLLAAQELGEKKFLADVNESFLDQFEYLPAKVINNSITNLENYITLNIGSKDGVEKGMGVLGTSGVVGQVIAVSEHYATVMSMLHTDCKISSQLESNKTLGATTWDGKNFKTGLLTYVPRHIKVNEGEVVVTSGYNSVFPEGIKIGKVKEIKTPKHESFHEIKIDFATDFSNLYYVYIAKGKRIIERKKLEESFLDNQ